ncbi:MAG: nuclear transport factor 2 family protein [Novosphingobium sp.]
MTEFVVAECAIRQLHARYVDAVWRKDMDAFGDCFAEDAEWRVAGQVMRGRTEIVKAMGGAFQNYRRILMTFRTPILEVGDGVASGRTYVSENSQFADGRPFGPIGIYFERFVDEGDRWRFKWRLFQTNYAGPPDLSEPFFDVPDYGPPPGMPPLDEMTIDRSGAGPRID